MNKLDEIQFVFEDLFSMSDQVDVLDESIVCRVEGNDVQLMLIDDVLEVTNSDGGRLRFDFADFIERLDETVPAILELADGIDRLGVSK